MTDFQQLYNDYFKDVYLYTLSLCKDIHIAEDITSETFIKAIKNINSFKGKCDIRVWLCQIAKNTYFTNLSKDERVTFLSNESDKIDSFNIEHSLSIKESSMEIHHLLHKLDEPYKEVFSLRVFGELSFKDIGSLFQKSENWACVTYHRARKKIYEKRSINNENNL